MLRLVIILVQLAAETVRWWGLACRSQQSIEAENLFLGTGSSGDFRVFRASISTDVSSCAPSQTLPFPAIPEATTDGAAVSQLRKMTQRPQVHQNGAFCPTNFPWFQGTRRAGIVFGNNIESSYMLERSPEIGSHARVFMLTGYHFLCCKAPRHGDYEW